MPAYHNERLEGGVLAYLKREEGMRRRVRRRGASRAVFLIGIGPSDRVDPAAYTERKSQRDRARHNHADQPDDWPRRKRRPTARANLWCACEKGGRGRDLAGQRAVRSRLRRRAAGAWRG